MFKDKISRLCIKISAEFMGNRKKSGTSKVQISHDLIERQSRFEGLNGLLLFLFLCLLKKCDSSCNIFNEITALYLIHLLLSFKINTNIIFMYCGWSISILTHLYMYVMFL